MKGSSVQACNARNRTQHHDHLGCVDWLARRAGKRDRTSLRHSPSGGATPEPRNLDGGRWPVTVSANALAMEAQRQPVPTMALLRQILGRERERQHSPQANARANRPRKRDSRERPAALVKGCPAELFRAKGSQLGIFWRAAEACKLTHEMSDGKNHSTEKTHWPGSPRWRLNTILEQPEAAHGNGCRAESEVAPGLPSSSECLA